VGPRLLGRFDAAGHGANERPLHPPSSRPLPKGPLGADLRLCGPFVAIGRAHLLFSTEEWASFQSAAMFRIKEMPLVAGGRPRRRGPRYGIPLLASEAIALCGVW